MTKRYKWSNLGARTVKISSGDLDAFDSPNMRPLVKAGIDFEVDYRAIHRPSREGHILDQFKGESHSPVLDENLSFLTHFATELS